MGKTEEEAYNFIEEVLLNNYQWSNDVANRRGLEVSMILIL